MGGVNLLSDGCFEVFLGWNLQHRDFVAVL